MNLSENIESAFSIVRKTYENVYKLMNSCDSISHDCGYLVSTDKFLRYKSDADYNGWLIDRFVKLYQQDSDRKLKNGWKNGAIFGMELNFENKPTVYLAKYEYDNISSWSEKVSPAAFWVFSDSFYCEDNGFIENALDNNGSYYVSEPGSEDIRNKYWGIKRIVYTSFDLIQLNSDNISEKIFGEFDKLKDL